MSTKQDSETSVRTVDILGSHGELASNITESRNTIENEITAKEPQSSIVSTDQGSNNLLDLDLFSMAGGIKGTSCVTVNNKTVTNTVGQNYDLSHKASLDPFATTVSSSAAFKDGSEQTTDARSNGFSFMSAGSTDVAPVTSSQIIELSPVSSKGPDNDFHIGSEFDFMGAQSNDLYPNASNQNTAAGLPFARNIQGEQKNFMDTKSGFNFMGDHSPVASSRNVAVSTQRPADSFNSSVNNHAGSRNTQTSQGRTAQFQHYNVQRTSNPQNGQYKSMNAMKNTDSNQNSASSNGFGFISGGKKAGAFDFVKDAMEASKKR